jgi:excisionase family DNA binding protein
MGTTTTTTTPLEPMLGSVEVARLFGLHPRTVMVKCRKGEIPAVKIGANRWRIPRSYVEAVLRGETPDSDAADVTAFLKELATLGPLTDTQRDMIRRQASKAGGGNPP